MALQDFGPVMCPKPPLGPSTTPNYATTLVIDATAEKVAFVLECPKAGNLAAVRWRTGTVTTGGTVDVRVETVDLATGFPTGTLLGTTTNAAQIVADANDNVEFRSVLTLPVTVTKSQLIAVVIVRDAVAGNMVIASFADDIPYLPYSALFTSSWVMANQAPVLALEYDDGSYPHIPGCWPITSISSIVFDSTTNPDEQGMIFTPTVDCRATGFWAWIDPDGDFEGVLYDTDGTSVLSDVTHDTNVRVATNAGIMYKWFDNTVVLAAGSTYRLVIKPGAGTVTIYAINLTTAPMMDAYENGQAWHFTSRNNGGAWSQVTTSRIFMGLIFDQFDDGAGGAGGSMTRPVALSGGLV